LFVRAVRIRREKAALIGLWIIAANKNGLLAIWRKYRLSIDISNEQFRSSTQHWRPIQDVVLPRFVACLPEVEVVAVGRKRKRGERIRGRCHDLGVAGSRDVVEPALSRPFSFGE
jgi:hypothetical protein